MWVRRRKVIRHFLRLPSVPHRSHREASSGLCPPEWPFPRESRPHSERCLRQGWDSPLWAAQEASAQCTVRDTCAGNPGMCLSAYQRHGRPTGSACPGRRQARCRFRRCRRRQEERRATGSSRTPYGASEAPWLWAWRFPRRLQGQSPKVCCLTRFVPYSD